MARSVALVLAVSLLGPGCGGPISHGSRTAMTLGGLALAAAGLVIMRPTPVDANHNGQNEWPLDDDYSTLLPGTMIFVGGMALAITGLAASSPPDEPPAPAPVRPPVPVSVMATAPTSTVEVLPYPAPLPELAVDEPTLRTGKQIRSAVATGHCEHAWVMWRGLRTTQPTYAAALVDGPVLSPCRRN